MFVKEPKLGNVKTRLANDTDETFALEVYLNCIKDLLQTLKALPYRLKLCVHGDDSVIKKEFGELDIFFQRGYDLGEKMRHAFEYEFLKGHDKILLIGSDTPHIPKESFIEGFEALNEKPCVIGPSLDGGYYLIGFNKNTFTPEIFEDITWSSEKVLEETLQKVNSNDVYLLQDLNDIDTLEDLKLFYNEYKNGYFEDSHSISFLKGKDDEKV